MKITFIFPYVFLLIHSTEVMSQRGEIQPVDNPSVHAWWNLLHYTIDIAPDYDSKFIKGTNTIAFAALQKGNAMQIDLQEPMTITRIVWRNAELAFKKDNSAYFITFPENFLKGKTDSITAFFEGKPAVAVKPPFGSGWTWTTDQKGRPWISAACQGSGASTWLPCKEVLYDEPDFGVVFNITVPDTLVAVANGRLRHRVQNTDHSFTYTWAVTQPINNYNIIPYIGHYVTWHENFAGSKGNLDCDYWVLDYNLEKAKKHFKQADTMLRCFEYWLGPYPFYEDSYKVVEAPLPGMEHQSAVAYGNHFENGYSGKNLSGTKWGLLWDFILVHESGHEWFGNSITENGQGHSWIHEGFTKYLETLYTEFVFGKEAGVEYTLGNRKRIKNDEAVIGSNTSDKYYKGSTMLHMIRQITGDSLFRGWLQTLNKQFYHSTIGTNEILQSLNDYTQKDFTKIFNQYLRTTKIPVLEYSFRNSVLRYRWTNCVNGFDMPLNISADNIRYHFITPGTRWKKLRTGTVNFKALNIDKNFYVEPKEVK